jgi:hypothetical protein
MLTAHNRLHAAMQSEAALKCSEACVQEKLHALKSRSRGAIRFMPNNTFNHALSAATDCPDTQERLQSFLYGDVWTEDMLLRNTDNHVDTVMLLRQPTGNYMGAVKFHTEVWMLSKLRTYDIHARIHTYADRFRCRGEPCQRLRLVPAGGGCLVCDSCTEHCAH